jgi:transcriptional regulator GlxA family with amidase domain
MLGRIAIGIVAATAAWAPTPAPTPAPVSAPRATQEPAGQEPHVCPPCGAACHDGLEVERYEGPGRCLDCGMALVPARQVPTALTLVTDGADLLGLALPMGVLAGSQQAFVRTVSDTTDPLRAGQALTIVPDYALDDAPEARVLILGDVAGEAIGDALFVEWTKAAAERAEHLLATGGGCLLLARTGLLDGAAIPSRPWWAERLAEWAPEVRGDAPPFVEHGKFLLALDPASAQRASLALVERLGGAAGRARAERWLGTATDAEGD